MTAVQRRGRGHRSELFATERPPRLVLRFAIVLSLTLASASALILIVVHHFAISEAERAATRHASLVASTLLRREVRAGDLAQPVSRIRRRELDRRFAHLLPASDLIELSLVRKDGLVTYATDRRTIGTTASAALASSASGKMIVSGIGRDGSRRILGESKALETYAPIGRSGGAARILQPYSPIEDAARSVQLRVGVVLEGLLLVLFLVFVPWLARVTRRIQQQIDRIHFQAYYDGLTGLPNRAHLFEHLETAVHRAAHEQRQLAVLLVDLDRFREVNNALGHDIGDDLLVKVARRLQVEVGSKQLLARLGGDEFAIVIGYDDEKEVKGIAEGLRAALEPSTRVGGVQLAVDSTVGIAFFPKDGGDAETLLKHAEVATYAAKEWHVGVLGYSPSVDPHDPEQLELVAALRDAAEHGELQPHYQPKIELATGTISGFEALVYWNHPTRGLLPPGAFVPTAERTGAIRHVTRAMLLGAVKQLHDWTPLDESLTVAVNLTAIDLLDPNLPKLLRALLRKHGVEPERLCVELTERTVMAAPDRAAAIIKRIVGIGVRVSIDDFGAGHASLAQLRNLPVHEVKIDRSFVSDMTVSSHDRMIVLAAIQLGHSLGLRVVAEGVETTDVQDALREQGCDYAQGFLYGRPEPVDSATSLLGSRDRAAA